VAALLVDGKLFALFVVLILWHAILSRVGSWLKVNDAIVEDAIKELTEIKCLKNK